MFHDSFGHWHWHPAISNAAHGENLSALPPPRAFAARVPRPPPHFARMTPFVRIALAGAGSFAEVNIVEGDTPFRVW